MSDDNELNLALIVDDKDSRLFLIQYLLLQANCIKSNILLPSGFSALEYLKRLEKENGLWPDLIFLNLTMNSTKIEVFSDYLVGISKSKNLNSFLVGYNGSPQIECDPQLKHLELVDFYRDRPLSASCIHQIISELKTKKCINSALLD